MRVKVDGPLVASGIERELGAATAGLGVICTFEEFLREALDRGELTEVLPDWSQSFSGPFLYYPSRNMPAPLRLRRFCPQGYARPTNAGLTDGGSGAALYGQGGT